MFSKLSRLAVLLVLLASPAFADSTINALSAGTTPAGTELVPVYQGANPAVSLTTLQIDQIILGKNNTWTGTNTFGAVSLSGTTFSGITGSTQCLHVNSSGVLSGTGSDCGSGGGSGTVTSVGLSMPGIFTVSGSPVTTSGTLTATASGTSGGIPYFSSSTALASSGALTANLPVIGGGAGVAPTVGSVTGNTTKFATSTGTLTTGDCVKIDANGNFIDNGSTCGGGGGSPGGTNGQIQYNNAGAFGGYAVGPGLAANTTNGLFTSLPDRTVTVSYTIAAADMGGVVNFNGTSLTATLPAISSTVLATGMSVEIVNYNSSSLTISTTATLNNCPTTLYQGGFCFVTSNGTSLDGVGFAGFGAVSGDLTISAAGVATLATSGVTAGSYTNANITVDAKGRVTVAANGSAGSGCTTTGSSILEGNGSGGCSNVTVGTGLTFSAGTLSATSASGAIPQPQGRLTLTSGTPVMTADATAQGTIYYDCYQGKNVPYYTGTADALDTIGSCQVSTTMVSAASTGQITASGVFDIWWEGNTHHNICIATSAGAGGGGGGWASDTGGSNTARGTGFTQIHNTRGYWTNQNAVAHCYNGSTDYGSVAADQLTYLGSVYTTAAGQTGMQFFPTAAAGGSNNVMGLSNAYNRVRFSSTDRDSTSTFNYNATAWEVVNNNTNNRVTFIDGLGQSAVYADFSILVKAGTTVSGPENGTVLDSTSGTPTLTSYNGWTSNANYATLFVHQVFSSPGSGLHFGSPMIACDVTGDTVTWAPGNHMGFTIAVDM